MKRSDTFLARRHSSSDVKQLLHVYNNTRDLKFILFGCVDVPYRRFLINAEYLGIYWEVYLVMFGGKRGEGRAWKKEWKFSRNLEEVIFTDKQNRITILCLSLHTHC